LRRYKALRHARDKSGRVGAENRSKRVTEHLYEGSISMNPQQLTGEELNGLGSQAMEALAAMVEALGKEAKPDVRVTRLANVDVQNLRRCSIFTPEPGFHLFVKLETQSGEWVEITPNNDVENAGAFVVYENAEGDIRRIVAGAPIVRTADGWVIEGSAYRVEIMN